MSKTTKLQDGGEGNNEKIWMQVPKTLEKFTTLILLFCAGCADKISQIVDPELTRPIKPLYEDVDTRKDTDKDCIPDVVDLYPDRPDDLGAPEVRQAVFKMMDLLNVSEDQKSQMMQTLRDCLKAGASQPSYQSEESDQAKSYPQKGKNEASESSQKGNSGGRENSTSKRDNDPPKKQMPSPQRDPKQDKKGSSESVKKSPITITPKGPANGAGEAERPAREVPVDEQSLKDGLRKIGVATQDKSDPCKYEVIVSNGGQSEYTVTITIIPDAGYKVDGKLINGQSIPSDLFKDPNDVKIIVLSLNKTIETRLDEDQKKIEQFFTTKGFTYNEDSTNVKRVYSNGTSTVEIDISLKKQGGQYEAVIRMGGKEWDKQYGLSVGELLRVLADRMF